MTDLVERLRAVNPVSRCDPPAIEDVWRKLDARESAGEEMDSKARNGRRAEANSPTVAPRRSVVARAVRWVPMLAGVGLSLAVLIVALSYLRPAPRQSAGVGNGSTSHRAWNATDGQGPSLSALMAHFAVLRRPATRAERAALPTFAVGIGTGTSHRNEKPTVLRLLGDADGIPVYFAVYADFRNGATGPVDGYSLDVEYGQGSSYAKGNYLIFPGTTGNPYGKRSIPFLSIVPDGVQSVRWRFACASRSTGCVLPAGRHTAYVPVRHNLAVQTVPGLNPGTSYASVVSVTWYHDDGTHTTYTNPNTAVPFAGAPPWPVAGRPPSQSYTPGNGPLAGESLAYWRSLYGVLRRPQDAIDRLAAAEAKRANTLPIVPDLTRVVLDTDHALVFLTISAVNPDGMPAGPRYVADAWSIVQTPDPSTQYNGLTPGVQEPLGTFAGNTYLQYSIVPDNVTKVQWSYTCNPACGHSPPPTQTLHARHNIIYTTINQQHSGSWSIEHVSWYVRGQAKPLRLGR